MTVSRSSTEHRDDDVGPPGPDDLHHVVEQRILRPVRIRFLRAFREAEVVRAREELVGAIDSPGCKKLFRPDDAELLAQLVSDEVLSAIAASQRQVCRAGPPAALEPRDEICILIVRVSTNQQHARVIRCAAVAITEMLARNVRRIGDYRPSFLLLRKNQRRRGERRRKKYDQCANH
jgi:hypothetical protein